jgi:plastocyanin
MSRSYAPLTPLCHRRIVAHGRHSPPQRADRPTVPAPPIFFIEERRRRARVGGSEEEPDMGTSKPILTTIVAMAALLLVSSVDAGAESAGTRVEIKAHRFGVPELTVPVGTTVTWINHDDDPHTVTSTDNVFRSPGLDTDETWAYTFTRPGTYPYYCTLHPLMTGTVIVRSGS